MGNLPFAATTPVSVSRVGLKARDAETLAAYYRAVVGLEELSRERRHDHARRRRPAAAGDRGRSAAKPDDPRSAGLFHTAFLLPSRADLGRWIKHAIDKQIPIDGASDHLVSEALYLTDPEGNGIEIYADRPHETWKWNGSRIEMATIKLDIPSVVADVPAGDAGWQGAPENSVIGHVHLRVGDPEDAEKWWHDEFGFDTVAQIWRRGGVPVVRRLSPPYRRQFLAQRRRRPARSVDAAGLSWVEMQSEGRARRAREDRSVGHGVRSSAPESLRPSTTR